MQRTFIYFAAFTGMASVFAATLLVVALVLGAPDRAEPSASAPVAGGPVGEFTITAFDLGFEPAMVHVDGPGTYTVTFVNDGGVPHDVTFADGTTIAADGARDGHGRGDGAGRGHQLHLLGSGPCRRRDDRGSHGRGGRRLGRAGGVPRGADGRGDAGHRRSA